MDDGLATILEMPRMATPEEVGDFLAELSDDAEEYDMTAAVVVMRRGDRIWVRAIGDDAGALLEDALEEVV